MRQKCSQDYLINEALTIVFDACFPRAFLSPRQIPARPNRLSLLQINKFVLVLAFSATSASTKIVPLLRRKQPRPAAGCRPLEKVGQREFTRYTCPPSIFSRSCFLSNILSLSLFSIGQSQLLSCILSLSFLVYLRPFSSSGFIIAFLRISVSLFIFFFESRSASRTS